jgi:hypothetical protein
MVMCEGKWKLSVSVPTRIALFWLERWCHVRWELLVRV